MAWVQINLDLAYLNVCQGTIVNFDCCENSWINRQSDEANIAFIAQYLTGDFAKDNDLFPTQETEIYRNGEYSITIKGDGTSASTASQGWQIRFKKDNSDTHLVWQSGGNGRYISYFKWALAINEEEQKGAFVFGRYSHDNYSSSVGRSNSNEDSSNTAINLYNWLVGAIPPAYNWQSVPSITGKNNTVSLTTLKEESINDGSPVDDATASAFNNAPNSCSVGGIVSKDLPIVENNPLTIALKYDIPELTDSTYTVCKVVAKKNKIPKSKTDGDKIIDISPTSHACVITGLEQETKYYVMIFLEDSLGGKAESDPKSITTGKQEGDIKAYISVNKVLRENDFKEYATWEKKTT